MMLEEGPIYHTEAPPVLTAYQVGATGLRIVPAPAARSWMSATDERFANRCLPMLIANQAGWLILNDASFIAEWSGGDDVRALSVTYESRAGHPLAGSYFGYGILTWSIPYVFRTPPSVNLLVRGPANAPKDGVCPLEGIVETDWASATFTMNWKITRPHAAIRFAVDDPICMIVPQRRGELERFTPEIRPISADPRVEDEHRLWSGSRERFLRRMGARSSTDSAPWQRDYFQGRNLNAVESHPEHQTRLRLRTFDVAAPTKASDDS